MSASRERILLAWVVFAVLFAQVLLYPGIPQLVGALGAGAVLDAGGQFLGIELLAFVLFAGAWGAASDTLGRRVPLIVAGALAGAAGYAALAGLVAAEAQFSVVLAVRFLQGAATVGAFSLAMTMLMDLGGGHGRNMGAAGIAIGLGTAVGAPIGGRLYEVSVLAPLVASTGLLVAAAVGTVAVPDRAPGEHHRGIRAILASLRSQPGLGIPYAFGLIDRLTAGFFALVGTVYFQFAFGIGPGTTGIVLGLFFAPFALLQYPFGVLSDRIGRVVPMAAGSLSYGVAVVAVGHVSELGLAALLMVVVGVTGAVMAPATMALVTDLSGPGSRGVAMGGFNTAGSLGFLLGIVGGETVASVAGFRTAFLAAGLLEVTIAIVALPALLGLDVDRSRVFGDE